MERIPPIPNFLAQTNSLVLRKVGEESNNSSHISIWGISTISYIAVVRDLTLQLILHIYNMYNTCSLSNVRSGQVAWKLSGN